MFSLTPLILLMKNLLKKITCLACSARYFSFGIWLGEYKMENAFQIMWS